MIGVAALGPSAPICSDTVRCACGRGIQSVQLHLEVLSCVSTTGVLASTTMPKLAEVAEVHQGLARSGRGAGRRSGDWTLRVVTSGNVRDGWLDLDGLAEFDVARSAWTERHLLRPFDVLLTARSWSTQSALVPPEVTRTVAGVTLLVVRPRHPESGMGHYLWYFLTSAHGRAQLARRVTRTTTITALSGRDLGEIEIPLPPPSQLDAIARLVEATETAYASEILAAQLRREDLRDAILAELIDDRKDDR